MVCVGVLVGVTGGVEVGVNEGLLEIVGVLEGFGVSNIHVLVNQKEDGIGDFVGVLVGVTGGVDVGVAVCVLVGV